MRWYEPIAWLIALCLFAWGLNAADAATFSFENRGDKKAVYILYWLDHPFKSWYPVNMAGGELQSGQSRSIRADYDGVVWQFLFGNAYEERAETEVVLESSTSHVHVVWDGEEITWNENKTASQQQGL